MTRPLHILLADDSQEFLEAAAALLSRDPRVRIVGRATDGSESVRLSKELVPDLILIDLKMPVMDGLAATRRIKAGSASPTVIIVSLHDHPEYRRGASEAGADGFIPKARFTEAVSRLIDGWFGPEGAAGRGGVS